ncbi:hypothetical protein Cni_G09574 [Canna indica]|uniref:NAD-dependent epimerase/dehydratase domain-containing protein n=1 Tax=Canna indica TaxID=4628 RepID=A0AAQ3Q6K0_9LILI|nr:hypothetical protein Cni_G09574 [Canna indica]
MSEEEKSPSTYSVSSSSVTSLGATSVAETKRAVESASPDVGGSPHPPRPKKVAEDIILDFSKRSYMAVMMLRYFNVIGSDPKGRLGEAPRTKLREHGRIFGACFDAALGIISGLKVKGTYYPTSAGTCIRDYIDVTDLVDAHVKALDKARPSKVGIYNVGTGKASYGRGHELPGGRYMRLIYGNRLEDVIITKTLCLF